MLYFPPIDFRRTPVTLLLVAVTVALTLIREIDDNARKTYFIKLVIWSEIWAGEFWRPLTTTLLHGDLLHALFNLYCILLFGVPLETWIGSWRIAGLMALFGYVSSLAQFALDPLFGTVVPNVGLSGVVYGLFGVFWVGSRYRSHYAALCPPQIIQWMLFWFVLCIVLTHVGVFRVANIAHGAGLGLGLLIGLAMFDVRRRTQWIAATCASAGAVLATLVICPWHEGFWDVRLHGLWWVERLL